MTSDEFKKILREKGLPVPGGEILQLRYRLWNEDWFALVEGTGWLWLDGRAGARPVWLRSTYGPA